MKKHILIVLISFFGMSISAQTVSKRDSEFNLENKIAIQGYDPVPATLSSVRVPGVPSLLQEMNL